MNSLLIPLQTANRVLIEQDRIKLFKNDNLIFSLFINNKSYSKQYELTTFHTDKANIECSMDSLGNFGNIVNINLI